jgi:LytS/YehU family sensor histidine kinase
LARQQYRRRLRELEEELSEARLAEVSLGALRARIDPEYVFQTLSRLEHLYEDDPSGADRLLDELVSFLRRALADVQALAGDARAA